MLLMDVHKVSPTMSKVVNVTVTPPSSTSEWNVVYGHHAANYAERISI